MAANTDIDRLRAAYIDALVQADFDDGSGICYTGNDERQKDVKRAAAELRDALGGLTHFPLRQED